MTCITITIMSPINISTSVMIITQPFVIIIIVSIISY